MSMVMKIQRAQQLEQALRAGIAIARLMRPKPRRLLDWMRQKLLVFYT